MNIVILLLCSLSIDALKITKNTKVIEEPLVTEEPGPDTKVIEEPLVTRSETKVHPQKISSELEVTDEPDQNAHGTTPYMQFLANNMCGCLTEPTNAIYNITDISKCFKSGVFVLPSTASFFQNYAPLPPINTVFEDSWKNWQQQQQQLWNNAMQLRNAQLQTVYGTRQQRKRHRRTEIEERELPFSCTIDDNMNEMYGEWYVDENNFFAREKNSSWTEFRPLKKCLNFILAESSGVTMVEMDHYHSVRTSEKCDVNCRAELRNSTPWEPCMSTAIKRWQLVTDRRGMMPYPNIEATSANLQSIYKTYAMDNNRRCAYWLDMVSNRKVAKCCSENDYDGCVEGLSAS